MIARRLLRQLTSVGCPWYGTTAGRCWYCAVSTPDNLARFADICEWMDNLDHHRENCCWANTVRYLEETQCEEEN